MSSRKLKKKPYIPTKGEILEADIREISLVDSPANARKFLMLKREESGMNPELYEMLKGLGLDVESYQEPEQGDPETLEDMVIKSAVTVAKLEDLVSSSNDEELVNKANKPMQRPKLLKFLEDLISKIGEVLKVANGEEEMEQEKELSEQAPEWVQDIFKRLDALESSAKVEEEVKKDLEELSGVVKSEVEEVESMKKNHEQEVQEIEAEKQSLSDQIETLKKDIETLKKIRVSGNSEPVSSEEVKEDVIQKAFAESPIGNLAQKIRKRVQET